MINPGRQPPTTPKVGSNCSQYSAEFFLLICLLCRTSYEFRRLCAIVVVLVSAVGILLRRRRGNKNDSLGDHTKGAPTRDMMTSAGVLPHFLSVGKPTIWLHEHVGGKIRRLDGAPRPPLKFSYLEIALVCIANQSLSHRRTLFPSKTHRFPFKWE